MLHKTTLIIETPQEPWDFKEEDSTKAVIGEKGSVLSAALVLILLASLPVVLGSFFNLERDLFETGKAHAEIVEKENLQTMALLRAPLSPLAEVSGVGGPDDFVVDGEALQSSVGPAGTSADVIYREEKPSPDQISLYVVREGDTLGGIASMFSVTANTIAWANDLDGPIQPGDELVILPVPGVRHTVEKGQTLSGIADKYHADDVEVARYNGISPDESLVVGSVLIIPDGEIDVPKKSRSTSVLADSSYFRKPVSGRKTQGLHGYNGVDFGAPIGTPIYASASGHVIVSRAGAWNGGYGNYIVIKHPNGTQTLYAHNSKNSVWVGQWVEAGQLIGYVGSTGRSTGPHLHFEVRGASNPF